MKIVSLLFHDVYASEPSESGFRSHAADRYKLSIPAFEAQIDGLSDAGIETLAVAAAFVETGPGGANGRIPNPESRLLLH